MRILKDIQKLSASIGRFFDRVDQVYRKVLGWSLKRKKTIVFGTLFLLVASLGGVKLVGVELMPGFDQGEISASFEVPAGTPAEETRNLVSQLEQFLLDFGVTEVVHTSIGGGGFMGGGSNEGEFYIRLVPPNERERSTNELIRILGLLRKLYLISM